MLILKIMKIPFSIFLLSIIIILFLYWRFKKPSNNKNWSDDQEILQYADIKNNKIFIHNIRNFDYSGEFTYKKRYYDKNFNLDKIKKAYYVLTPFSSLKGLAHSFLSFEFENNIFLSISIEIRKKKGDKFSPLKGFFKKYEIMYLIGSEHDLIKQRSNYRKNKVFLYPLKLQKKQIQMLFLNMIKKTNKLKKYPEFYNTITNACAINIVRHLNKVLPEKIPLSWKIFLPEYSDKLLYDLGLIDTKLIFKKIREKFIINKKAENTTENDFSLKIRN